jgi:hypothetical protein
MIKDFLKISAILVLLGLNLNLVMAQSNLKVTTPEINPTGDQIYLPGSDSPQSQNQLQSNFLPALTTTVVGVTGGISLLFVIIGAVQILTAYGKDDQIEKAKKTLTWAIAGLVLAILSYSIVQIIISINLNPKK